MSVNKKKEKDVRFKKFGTISFTATTKVNDFIDKLEAGQVAGTQCNKCNLIFFPPRADCYKCLGSNIDWFNVSGAGKLITYSQLMYAPVGFNEDLPYTIAILDYGNYKIFGRIAADIPLEELYIDLEMQTEVNRLPNGQINYVFKKLITNLTEIS